MKRPHTLRIWRLCITWRDEWTGRHGLEVSWYDGWQYWIIFARGFGDKR